MKIKIKVFRFIIKMLKNIIECTQHMLRNKSPIIKITSFIVLKKKAPILCDLNSVRRVIVVKYAT